MRINSINNQYQINARRNTQQNISQKQHNPSFGGVKDVLAEPLSNFYDMVAGTNKFQNFVTKFSRTNSFTHLMVAESCFLSGFYMINTLRNKNIKKEQKPQMLINDALTLGVSTAGAYFVEDKITTMVEKGAEKYFSNNAEFYKTLGKGLSDKSKMGLLDKVTQTLKNTNPTKLAEGIDDVVENIGAHLKGIVQQNGKEKAFHITEETVKGIQSSVKEAINTNKDDIELATQKVRGLIDDAYDKVAARAEADKLMPGIQKLKVLVIFGIIYRYLGPVVITPIANKLSSKFFDKKKPDETKAQQSK